MQGCLYVATSGCLRFWLQGYSRISQLRPLLPTHQDTGRMAVRVPHHLLRKSPAWFIPDIVHKTEGDPADMCWRSTNLSVF